MKRARLQVLSLCVCSVLAACTHHDVSTQLQTAAQSFEATRDQAVAVVRAAKADVGPMGIDVVNVKYASLQQQANGYLGLIVESVDTNSFDQTKGAVDADGLVKAIDGFNGSVFPLLRGKAAEPASQPAAAPSPLQVDWVGRLQSDLVSGWPAYEPRLSAMSSDQRTAIGEQLKQKLAWPNFQDISAAPPAPQASASP